MSTPPTDITVATLLEPAARRRLDAAAQGRFAARHADSVRAVIRVVRERPVDAILVSPACLEETDIRSVEELVNRFPGVPTVAVVSEHGRRSSERLLALGATGVRDMLDLTGRDGWERLRSLLSHPATPTAGEILAVVLPALGDPSPDCRAFFQLLVRLAPSTPTVRALTRRLGVENSTFVSRFVRAALPSPKRYLALIRLVHAAKLFEAPGLSVADVAHRLEFSSAQSLGRHVRTSVGVTATEFRRRYSFVRMTEEFVARLIVPYRPALVAFQPLGEGVGTFGRRW